MLPKIELTTAETALFEKVATLYPGTYFWPQVKLVALFDIYSGVYPEIHSCNQDLMDATAARLVAYCKEAHQLIPSTPKNKHPLIEAYRNEIQHRDNANGHKEKSVTKNIVVPSTPIVSPYTQKPYLHAIQANFSLPSLPTVAHSYFTSKEGLFLISNDVQVEYYLSTITSLLKQPEIEVPTDKNVNFLSTQLRAFNLLQSDQSKKVGIVIGSSNIISLLPDINANDIILLDIEPVVHHFVLSIKNFVLNVTQEDTQDMKTVKDCLLTTLNKLPYVKKNYAKELSIEIELWKNLHFLSSAKRFLQCQAALREKDLLPIKMDISDCKNMKKFADLLKPVAKVSFLNLTNVSDYVPTDLLMKNLQQLPLTKDCPIISTTLKGFPSSGLDDTCFVANNLKQLREQFDYVNHRKVSRYPGSFSF